MTSGSFLRTLLAAAVCGVFAGCVSSGGASSGGTSGSAVNDIGKQREQLQDEMRDLRHAIEAEEKLDPNGEGTLADKRLLDRLKKEDEELKKKQLEELRKKVRKSCYSANGAEDTAASAFDALLGGARPLAPHSDLLLPWGGGGSDGGHDKPNC